MQSKEKDNLIFIRLFTGEDLFSSIKSACKKHEVETAVVLSGLGQLKDFSLAYFVSKGDYAKEDFSVPHELVSLTGNILYSKESKGYKFHLHAVFSDEKKKAIGGHLAEGGKVCVTNEIILLRVNLSSAYRKFEEDTGLEGLFLK